MDFSSADITIINFVLSNKIKMELDYIINSHLNKNKQHKYSFGRSSRFNSPRPNCSQVSYQLPKLENSPKAGFGYGTKYTFEMFADKNPSPSQYDVGNHATRRGFSFGEGREKIISGSYIPQVSINNPYPGKYEHVGTNRGKSFSFISKHKEDSFIPQSDTPGPGTYDSKDTDPKTGKRFNSKFKQSSPSITKQKRFRHQLPKTQIPGPGAYASASLYKSSKYKSIESQQFMHSARTTYVDQSIKASITPGPKYYPLI